MNQLLYGWGLRVGQIDLAVQLFAQSAPVEFYEGVFLAHFFYDFVGNSRPLAESCQVQLLHFSTAAHIVHQVVGISFTSHESHIRTSAYLLENSCESYPDCSVRTFHYSRQL